MQLTKFSLSVFLLLLVSYIFSVTSVFALGKCSNLEKDELQFSVAVAFISDDVRPKILVDPLFVEFDQCADDLRWEIEKGAEEALLKDKANLAKTAIAGTTGGVLGLMWGAHKAAKRNENRRKSGFYYNERSDNIGKSVRDGALWFMMLQKGSDIAGIAPSLKSVKEDKEEFEALTKIADRLKQINSVNISAGVTLDLFIKNIDKSALYDWNTKPKEPTITEEEAERLKTAINKVVERLKYK